MKKFENTFEFEKSDIKNFAKSSHDFNPLHVDENFAKTTLYGENVVHGMLAVEHILQRYNYYPTELKVKFLTPMFVGHLYSCSKTDTSTKSTILITENNSSVLKIVGSGVDNNPLNESAAPSDKKHECGFVQNEPLDIIDDFLNRDFDVCGDYEADPSAQAQLANIRLCSYIIGMIMPGKNSLFMEAAMQIDGSKFKAAALSYRVSKDYYNQDLGILKLIVQVYCKGELFAVNHLTAYIRATLSLTSDLPKPIEAKRADKVVVVFGGTKGIGAELVKRYAVQGARVIATYYHDDSKAEALKTYLLQNGYDVEFAKCDVSNESDCKNLYSQIKSKYNSVGAMYICAALAPHNIELYCESYSILESYLNESLRKFYMPFFTFLNLMAEDSSVNVFSSVAMQDKKLNYKMIEYICAKGVIENIVENISYKKENEKIKFFIIRAPKMLTEMNNTPSGRTDSTDPKFVAEKIFSEVEFCKKEENLIYLNFNGSSQV